MTYRILVPIDTFDEYVTELASTVNNLCLHADSRLQLLHVLPDLEDINDDEIDENLQDASDLLSDFSALLNCPDEHITHHTLPAVFSVRKQPVLKSCCLLLHALYRVTGAWSSISA